MSGSQKDSLPPFLTSAAEVKQAKLEPTKDSKLISVDPMYLKFHLTDAVSTKVNLHISNVTHKRVAWRLRSNAPTRYVVNPACGFLTSGESIDITVELANTNKFSDRHKFIIQAMEAKDDEKDRRKVWESDRAQSLDNLQCIRIYSMASTGPKTNSNVSESSNCSTGISTSFSSNPSSNQSSVLISNTESSIQNSTTNSVSNIINEGSGATSSRASTHSLSNVSTCSEIDVADRIIAETSAAKSHLDVKSKASRKMIEVLNEVKKVEVELDRVGVQCKHLSAQVNTITAHIAALVERSLELDQQIKSLTSKN